ncbi:MAG: 50S ribosomal protein L19 [Planctomycetes bacterium]|nr:50S ribosomal protein L19 [Planctomycetota bacterium]
MSQQLLESISAKHIKQNVTPFGVGDTINVSFRIVEGDKERQQVFQGVVISRKGRGIDEMVVVRKIVDEVGVERIFPLNSPMVAEIEMVRRGDARRAKLYYLRERTGKSRRLRDKRRGLKHDVPVTTTGNAAPADAPAAKA